ncbi:MAG: hypothetical protein U0V73_15695 [Acidimicrobiia bacterium]
MPFDLAAAVERGDAEELLRVVDELCGRHAWAALVRLRDQCCAAVERGKQLWPIAHHIEYRLALEAPGEWAGPVLVDGAGTFTLGPLSEVAASTHTWAELAPYLTAGPVASLTAHERVVRGEDLADVELHPAVLDLPTALQEWEPAYPRATYRPHTAEFPAPALPALEAVDIPSPVEVIDDGAACRALTDLVAAWTHTSDGRAEAVAVRGPALAAVGALGARRARAAEVPGPLALAHLAWAAASGGAYGRRRGMATARFDVWLAVGEMARVSQWPLPSSALGAAVGRFDWWVWDAGEPTTGWALRVAASDPKQGIAWALTASDAR